MLAIHEFFFGFGHPLSSSGKQVVNIYTSTTVRSLSSVYERKFRLRLATHMDTVTELFSPSLLAMHAAVVPENQLLALFKRLIGRWRGQHAWSAGAEWRPWVIPEGFAIYEDIRLERGGLALFLDLGSVSESLDQLIEEPVHYSYGIGLRFTFERQALFRADLGRSDDGEMNMSIRYGLPF